MAVTVTAKKLYGINGVSSTLTTGYTVPASTAAIVKNLIVCNPSANAVTFTVIVSGVTIFLQSVTAGQTVTLDLTIVMNAAETIQVQASTTTVLNTIISGVEVA